MRQLAHAIARKRVHLDDPSRQEQRIDAMTQLCQEILRTALRCNDKHQQPGGGLPIEILWGYELAVDDAVQPCQNAVEFSQRRAASAQFDHVHSAAHQTKVAIVQHFYDVAERVSGDMWA